MKILSMSVAVLLLLSCVEKETKKEQTIVENSLHGTWQASEQKVSMGGKAAWKAVDEGAEFTLNTDGTFTSELHDGCDQGTYTIVKNTIAFNYNCPAFDRSFRYGYFMLKGDLVWTPKDILCVEGCLFKFKKQ